MNEMRLPGLIGPANTESSAGTVEPRQDAARDFDAVMSRYSRRPAEERASGDRVVGPRQRATDGSQGAAKSAKPETKETDDAEQSTPADGTATGRPVACTTAAEEDAPQAGAGQDADAAALVAAVVGAVQLAATTGAPGADKPQELAQDPEQGEAAEQGAAKAAGLPASTVAAVAQDDEPTGTTEPAATVSDKAQPERAAPPLRGASGRAKDAAVRLDAQGPRAENAAPGQAAQRAGDIAEAVVVRPANATTAGTTAQAPDLQPLAAAAPSAATSTYTVAHATITSAVGTAGFASDLAHRLVVFAGQKVQRAEIALSPAELGPVAVSIEVRGQEATLAFSAAHGATRAALEEALPRLREMLSAQGLQLAGAHVGGESRRDPYRPGRDGFGAAAGQTRIDGVPDSASASVRRRALGLIDVVV